MCPSSSGGLCVAGRAGGLSAKERLPGLPEVGAARAARQRHHHRALRTQDLAAGGRGEESREMMRRVGIVSDVLFIGRGTSAGCAVCTARWEALISAFTCFLFLTLNHVDVRRMDKKFFRF